MWSEIHRLERELLELEDESARVDRKLRECREAETYSHTLPRGYQGTAAQIARRIEQERKNYDWFPELPDAQTSFPLSSEDIEFLAEFHPTLDKERLNELSLDIGTFFLPNPDEFKNSIEELNAAERALKSVCIEVPKEQLDSLQRASKADLEAGRTFLVQLEEYATRASRVLGDLTGEILKDLLVGRDARWERLEQETTDLIKQIQVACERVGSVPIEVVAEIDNAKLLADTRRRLEHFENGGWRGWGFLAPRIVRDTRYIEERCWVNSKAPRDKKSLEILLAFLELKVLLQRINVTWPGGLLHSSGDPRQAASEVLDLVNEFCRMMEFFRTVHRPAMHIIPIDQRLTLAEPDGRATWRCLIETELARLRVQQAKRPLEAWLNAIRSLSQNNTHPCMGDLARAIEDCDVAKWQAGWEAREAIKKDKERFFRYQELLNKVRKVCPDLADLLQSTQGHLEWKDHVRNLGKAWAWAAARKWLRKVTDLEYYERLAVERHQLQKKKREKD